jgi:hypothetical protein
VTGQSGWYLAKSNLPIPKGNKMILATLVRSDGNAVIGVYITSAGNLNFIGGISGTSDYWGTITYMTD